jgi:hypothetical protein
MPYTEKQRKVLRAIEHGWKPKKAMKNVTPSKAATMLSHGTRKAGPAAKHLSK